MNNTNRLITSDNKGYAAYRFERDFNGGIGSQPGKGPFVAAFSTSNEVRPCPSPLPPSAPRLRSSPLLPPVQSSPKPAAVV